MLPASIVHNAISDIIYDKSFLAGNGNPRVCPHPKMFAVHLTVTNDAPFAFNYATSSPLPRCIANFTGRDTRPDQQCFMKLTKGFCMT